MKPDHGLLRTKSSQIFVIQISPKEAKTFKETLLLKLNDADKNTQVGVNFAHHADKDLKQEPVVAVLMLFCGQLEKRMTSLGVPSPKGFMLGAFWA